MLYEVITGHEQLEAVDEVGAVDRITAETDAGGLAEAALIRPA